MRKVSPFLVALLFTSFWASLSYPQAASAAPANFSMNRIVSDDDFTDAASMSVARIQSFLDSQSGVLKSHKVTVNGVQKSAAQIIYDAAQANGISPKVLLTTIQKESSMLTKNCFAISSTQSNSNCPNSNTKQYYLDWIVFYGWCDSCSTGTYKGFVNQINAAAKVYHNYLWGEAGVYTRGYTISGWGPGIAKSIPCIQSDFNSGRELCTPGQPVVITPFNAATSALYTYTPHPGGNYAFWKIWNGYNFSAQRLYPDGSLLRATGSGTVYLIDGGKKRPFASAAALVSRYSFTKVIPVSKDQLDLYDVGKRIAFANYSLLQAPNGGVYLLADDAVRPITSGAVFKAVGFSRSEVVKVKWDVINEFTAGEPITMSNIYPSGRLLRNNKTGAVFFVKDGVRRLIPSPDIYKNQFGLRKATPVDPSVIEANTKGAYMPFRDGELVTLKSGGPAYFVSNGQKLKIASWEAAKAYKFDKIWKNLIKTDQNSLDAMPTGATLDVDGVVQVASNP